MEDIPSRNKDLIIQKFNKVMGQMAHGTILRRLGIQMEIPSMISLIQLMVPILTLKKNVGILAKIGHHTMNLLLFLQDIGY